MALAAIADDGDFLVFDQVQIGILVIIHAHGTALWLAFTFVRRIGFIRPNELKIKALVMI
jgi:hypothetical protein